ncbi:MAG: OPT/YSL family transporter [Phycisphaerae bacterium]|nr:OPT/YSL family transporter [Phycisphaerae bacterium]
MATSTDHPAPDERPPDEATRPPASDAEGGNDVYHIPIAGFKGTPEEIERQWFEQCYKGRGDSMWQLTWRAVIMGSVLGGVLSLTNIYIGLKSGWGFGVAITACILSYAIWMTFHKIGLVKTRMTVLENNCMQSTASAAGYSTGGTLVSAIAAFILVNNDTIPLLTLMAWVFFLAILGVSMAIPMKRQMINIEQLRFPSGIAAAETLNALHTTGGKGIVSAKALGIAGVLSALSAFWTSGLHLLYAAWAKFEISSYMSKASLAVFGKARVGHTVGFSWEPMFLAAGAITGIRVCASMLLGGIICWVFLTPWALERDIIPLKISEAIPALPAEVDFANDPKLKKTIEYVSYANRLDWRGIMTAEQRDTLLAMSDDPDYAVAIARLHVRSQHQATAPLGELPAGVAFTDKLDGIVHFDPEQGLVADELIDVEQYALLTSLSTDQDYLVTVEDLYARSRLDSVEPLWSAAELSSLPRQVKIPPTLSGWCKYDGVKAVLLWRGPMSEPQRDELLKLSTEEPFQQAVRSLFTVAQRRALPAEMPAELAAVVRYDARRRALLATGAISKELERKLSKLSDDPAYQQTLSVLVAGSRAERALANFSDLVKWSLWGGASCMVTSGLFSFAFQWRSIVQALSGLGALFSRRKSGRQNAHQHIETPVSWFLGGQLVGGTGVVILAYYSFGMPVWLSILAILLSFFLALVACRVCGETDTTPVGAMGKVTQLMYGVITPRQLIANTKMNINLMAACITAGAADSASDLLIDLKSGYLLGANPRKQFIAQFAGIFMGTLVSVTAFSLIVPNADALGTAQFPAPAAQSWAAVAKLLSDGFSALHPTIVWAIIIGGSVGILLPLLEKIFPKRRTWVPSAAGLGLAFTFPWYYSLLFFTGAVLGLIVEKKWPKASEDFTFPIASGVIAGEALMGVALIFWEKGPQMFKQLTEQLFGG